MMQGDLTGLSKEETRMSLSVTDWKREIKGQTPLQIAAEVLSRMRGYRNNALSRDDDVESLEALIIALTGTTEDQTL
jgi:hypothetical protein